MNKELYEHGLEIAESVLYMKQHSVNCIPAAIYMITKIAPELQIQDFATDFILDLFKNATDVQKEDVIQITTHIKTIYEQLMQESLATQNWTEPLKKWIDNYKAYKPN